MRIGLEMSIRIPEIYTPLFELIEGYHKDVTLVIMTGGRYSGKSFIANIALANAMGFNGHKILNARYTMVSAEKSIIPDFKDKLDMLGLTDFYTINKKDISSNFDKSKMWFSGMKAGSNTQDSALKSLSDISLFYVEEASEIPTFEEWEKVDLSVRADNVQAFSMLVLNPTTTNHWIYKKFFKEKKVTAGFNGVVDGVLYIHSTWLDLEEDMIVKKHLPKFKSDHKFYIENNIEDLTGKELGRFVRYRDIILGGWRNSVENVIFENWETFTEWRNDKPRYHTLGLDFGFKDPNAIVETKVYEDAIYVRQHLFKPDVSNQDLANKIKQIELEHNGGKNMYTIADSARPEIIKELQKLGCAVVKCKKGAGSIESGIQKINSMNLFVYKDSLDLINELNHYHYVEKINILGERKIVPVDEYNHLIDSLRYSISLW